MKNNTTTAAVLTTPTHLADFDLEDLADLAFVNRGRASARIGGHFVTYDMATGRFCVGNVSTKSPRRAANLIGA